MGMSMGRGVAALIAHELGAAINQGSDDGFVFSSELERELAVRAEGPDARERRLSEKEAVLRASEQRLRAAARLIRA